jgi:thioredoxin-like negative regulator of GroEL
MSKSKNSAKKWLLAGAVVLALPAAFYFSPLGQSFMAARSAALTVQADSLATDRPYEALYNYQSAFKLDPKNTAAYTKAAALYLKLGQSDQALNTLSKLPSGPLSPEALLIKSRAHLEQGDNEAATASALQASVQHSSSSSLLLLGLCQLISQNPTELTAILSRLGTSEAATALKRASSHNTALGQVLYDQGLLRSSERVLMRQPIDSEAYLLLAKIHSNRGDWPSALESASAGLLIDPGKLDLRSLRRQIYLELGDRAAADREGELINRLQTGRI